MCVFLQFVVCTFWSLYLVDRELVYPKLLDNFIPQWLNHGMVSSGHQRVPPLRGSISSSSSSNGNQFDLNQWVSERMKERYTR